jgi:hypothetical protein
MRFTLILRCVTAFVSALLLTSRGTDRKVVKARDVVRPGRRAFGGGKPGAGATVSVVAMGTGNGSPGMVPRRSRRTSGATSGSYRVWKSQTLCQTNCFLMRR